MIHVDRGRNAAARGRPAFTGSGSIEAGRMVRGVGPPVLDCCRRYPTALPGGDVDPISGRVEDQ